MKDKYFIDTNVFIYAFDENEGKQAKANELIKSGLLENKGCISTQVIQEFINVSIKKFEQPLSIQDCHTFVDKVLSPLCHVFATIELYHRALDTVQRWGYSFYDSLIIAAAQQAECRILYSEDLQHGQKIGSLTIKNPFIELEK